MNGLRRFEACTRRLKRDLGYYDTRRRLRTGPFRRALRPTDVFLVGHPRSGNTWLAYMLAGLLFPAREDEITLANVGEFAPFVHGRDHLIRRYSHLPDPRVFRNENPQYPDYYPRTLYLMRDPRAVLASLWRMYQTLFDETDLRFDAFLTDYLGGSGIFGWWNSKLERWDRQVGAALDRAETDSRLLVVRYEEMVKDRGAALQRVLGFLALTPSEGKLSEAIERGAFNAMRVLEDRHGAEAYRGRARGEGNFVREGRIEGWRSEIDETQAGRIVEVMGSVMTRAGYL